MREWARISRNPNIYDLDLQFDAFDENAILNDDFTSSITMTYHAALPAPYLRAYANDQLLECDATYTKHVTRGRSLGTCDVTVTARTNLLARIRAEAYLPLDQVVSTRQLEVQFGGKCTTCGSFYLFFIYALVYIYN